MPTPFSSDLLFDEAACGLLVTDNAGTILDINQTLCSWLGFASSELIGAKRLQDLFTMGGRLFHHTHWAPLLQMQGSVAEIQIDMVCNDKSILPALINAKVRDVDGKRYIGVAVFVATDRKKYERELLRARHKAEQSLKDLKVAQTELELVNNKLSEADRKKDEFLATLAHELRNPLAPIGNVLQILNIKYAGDAQLNWATEVIARQVSQLTHLIDDLMEVSRITQGKLTLRKQLVDLKGILHQAIEVTKPRMEAANHTLVTEISIEPLLVDGDATRLVQVFTNLLNNAEKYTPAGGNITLRASVTHGEALVTVRDSGIGIEASKLEAIFDMFSQLTPALERSRSGLGIGLALVRGLIGLHGGDVKAHSEGEGKGSAFTVTLPLADNNDPQIDSQHKLASYSQTARKILIVDDNVDAVQSLAIALDLLNYTTRTAHNGVAGLAAVTEFQPEVIILDIGLPDMNGYELAQHIRKLKGTKVLLIAASGWGQAKDKERAKAAGFDSHLTKPINFSELENVLSSATQSG